jgi:hypothetical protein
MNIRPFFSFTGISERLELYIDKVAIVPINEATLDKEGYLAIPYSAITSIVINRGGLFKYGSIRLVVLGGNDRSGDFFTPGHDNVINFDFSDDRRNYEEAEKIKNFIEGFNEKQQS